MAESFTLAIGQQTGTDIPVSLTAPDGTVTAGLVDLTQFTGPGALDAVYLTLNDTTNRQQAEALGKRLFDGLIPPGSPIRNDWTRVLAQHPRAVLQLEIDAPDFREYPWELLWDAQDDRPALLGGVVRRVSGTPPTASASLEWPLRLLMIVGTDDGALPANQQIGTREEVAAVRRTLIDYARSIDMHVLWQPSNPAIRVALSDYQPHIVHFVGHGTQDLTSKRHALVIESATGTWMWDTIGIQTDFRNAQCVPRLVFLNACRSGSDRKSNLGLQGVFTERVRVGAVVAMQADVRGDLAARFSQAFYGHALVGAPAAGTSVPTIVEAVQKGRLALGGDPDIDWGLPALTFRSDVPIESTLRQEASWPTDPSFLVCREFDDARVYADDSDARREMILWMYPIGQARVPNVLILQGPPASGKSRLLHWCMESWAVAGSPMRYVRVDLPRGKNCLNWLLRLRAGELPHDRPDPERFLKAGLDLAPFMPFYDAVAREAHLMDGPQKVDDPQKRVALIDAFQVEMADNVSIAPHCERFIAGLQGLGKVILVFDQLSVAAIHPTLFSGFRNAFLASIGKRPNADIRVVLAVSRDDYTQFDLATLDKTSARVVGMREQYTPADLENLAVEALRFKEEEELRKVAQVYVRKAQQKTGLARLHFCQDFLEMDDFRGLGRMR